MELRHLATFRTLATTLTLLGVSYLFQELRNPLHLHREE